MSLVAAALWQKYGQLSAEALTLALPGRNRPAELLTCALQETAGAVHVTWISLDPLMVARRATISGSSEIHVTCTAPAVSWSAQVSSSAGRFLPGKASVNASALSCPYFCHSAAATRDITLASA